MKGFFMKKVYVGMCADVLHQGHINIIKEAEKHGSVTVGLLTDEAIASYKRLPLIPFEERKRIVENIKGVDKVIEQDSLDYVPNLRDLKPDYVVHGDDWKTGIQQKTRKRVLDAIEEWGGELIEPTYTKGISSTKLITSILRKGTTSDERRHKLRRLLESKPLVRALEVHNGLTGLIVEDTKIIKDNKVREFDAMWISSLTDSCSKGKPDTGIVDLSSRINTIEEVMDVTTKPMIVDVDNGGHNEHFGSNVKTLERKGVSAIIVEDKIGLKKNSLFGTDVKQNQDTIEQFCEKIQNGKKAQVTKDFMIIARTESLILKKGQDDAIRRAKAYIGAGADAIMIHSKDKDPSEILSFCKEYDNFDNKVPLVVVPSTYNSITESELIKAGANIVIYANHLIRSAYPAMLNTAKSILEKERSKEADEYCMPIKDIITLIDGCD